MKPLNLLIVSIRNEWLGLLEDSLSYAGYQFQIKQVNSKQSAIKAFHESKYDLLISNCVLPDGKITDLANVLGSQLPCLVMTEGHCPVTAERVLAVTETNYYINCSNKLGWIPALENTLAKWHKTAQQKIDQHNQSHDNLYKKVLIRCEELLAATGNNTTPHETIDSVFELLLEVMDLSRIYLCTPKLLSDGKLEITKRVEATASGVSLKHAFTKNPLEIPYFERWNASFSSGKMVSELLGDLGPKEQQWLSRHDIQSLLAIPIRTGQKWVAYMGAEDTFNAREWSEAETELLLSVSELIQKKYFISNKSSRLDQALFTSPA